MILGVTASVTLGCKQEARVGGVVQIQQVFIEDLLST